MGENIYMLPSDMNLHIKTGTAGYNNKILVSDSKFNLGKNDKVNAFPCMRSWEKSWVRWEFPGIPSFPTFRFLKML